MNNNKLNAEAVADIRENPNGLLNREFADKYGVSLWTINQVKCGYIYRPIDPETGQVVPKPPMGPAGRKRTAPKHIPAPCQCGCGEMTKGHGLFKPGHHTRNNPAVFAQVSALNPAKSDVQFLDDVFKRSTVVDLGFETPCLVHAGVRNNENRPIITRKGRTRVISREVYVILHPELDLSNGHKYPCHHICQRGGEGCVAPWHIEPKHVSSHQREHRSGIRTEDVKTMRLLHANGLTVGEIHKAWPEHSYATVQQILWNKSGTTLEELEVPKANVANVA